MSKIDKSVLLPPTLIALLGLSGMATAAQPDVLVPAQEISILEITIQSESAVHVISGDHEIAGTQCTSYSSGGTHCGHYSTGDQQREVFKGDHAVPKIQKFNV